MILMNYSVSVTKTLNPLKNPAPNVKLDIEHKTHFTRVCAIKFDFFSHIAHFTSYKSNSMHSMPPFYAIF